MMVMVEVVIMIVVKIVIVMMMMMMVIGMIIGGWRRWMIVLEMMVLVVEMRFEIVIGAVEIVPETGSVLVRKFCPDMMMWWWRRWWWIRWVMMWMLVIWIFVRERRAIVISVMVITGREAAANEALVGGKWNIILIGR